MTIKEINAERTKQRKLLQDKQESQQSYLQAHERIMQGLDVDEQELHDELVKRIKRHFKGVPPYVIASHTEFVVGVNDVSNVAYRYGQYSFNGINKKLADKMVEEYIEIYGDVEKESTFKLTYIPPALSDDSLDSFRYEVLYRINKIGKAKIVY